MDDLVVPSELCRNAVNDPEAVVDGAVWLIDHMCGHIGVADLRGLRVLDFGCGIRFTQAFLQRGVPVDQYVGVDVASEVIDFLRANVADPRFEYFRLDAYNELYNPGGKPLADLTVPELEGRQFDLICLFSVFTHLAPHDYVAMLKLLRNFVAPEGRLFYTVFIDELTDRGHGYVDLMLKAMGGDPKAVRPDPPDFRDADPDKPMLVALYSRRHALELIEGTGWKVESVSPPDAHLQHHIVCTPA